MNPDMRLLAESQAWMFHAAYERCLVVPNGVPNICGVANSRSTPLALPAYICAAFAAEVGLKVLLERAGITARGHDLEKLFKKLPNDLQSRIREIASPFVNDFDSDLARAKNTFNDLRYVFEYNGPTKEMNLRVVAAISMAANQLIGIDWSVTT